ncbi:MAG: putative membrane protein [Anaerolineales bacterium]|nr:putative membrane protein [Anaerolineales bacterium]
MTIDPSRRSLRLATLVGVAAAIVGVAAYLAASQATLRLGFPLDDAWIHQTYARNLALRGEWSFVPGQASGGSTAPLWTILLAIGARLGSDPRSWAFLLGTAALAGAAAAAVRVFRPRAARSEMWVMWLGLVFALEWHLVWAAASGMEVILLVALTVAVMLLSLPTVRRPLLVGALVGCGIWIRPDAVTLGLIPFLSIATRSPGSLARGKGLVRLGVGAALLAIPYLLFNLGTAGTIWPSTFYAKQAEYAELRQAPYLSRFLRLALSPLTGSGILLLPGVVLVAIQSIREKRWGDLGPIVWALSYVAIFAALLPVAYQHGRYQIPVLPVILILGWEGIQQAASNAGRPILRAVTRAWAAATVVVALVFAVLGARAYALDVAVIETEMVEAATWIAAHTESEALVAAHDIGALGYFGQRPVLDMAGLAESEVIPFLRDESRLAQYLTQAEAAYLMTFPGWYPSLTSCAEAIHASGGSFSPRQGGENMVVYRWPGPPVVPLEGCMLYSP